MIYTLTFCDSKASLAPFDPMGSIEEAVASELYGKPPGMAEENYNETKPETADQTVEKEEHLK